MEQWLERFIIDLNLCPFAGRVVRSGRVRVATTDADSETALLKQLHWELEYLQRSDQVETTLLVHPGVLTDFLDYNQFLDQVDELLINGGFEGEFQVASFHPHYQFAGTQAQDAENYSSRSPYPLLHILRESGVVEAAAQHPDVESIPGRNIDVLERLGQQTLHERWLACFTAISDSGPET